MYQKVKEQIQEYHMLKEHDRVIVGVSGGPDSICLLFVLLKLKKELELEVRAVHIHHGLRLKTADEDEAYVKRICEKWGVDLKIFHEDVALYAVQHKLTIEEAGRKIRRKRFEQVCEEWGGAKIALAHHKDDNAETLLLNLCRGCGLKGLGGIAPVEGSYIRPFLKVRKQEIESYLKKRGISYCTDETNLEDHYMRNRIRNRVLPYLEDQINEQTVNHMSDTMERMRDLAGYIQQEVCRYLEYCVPRKNVPGEQKRIILKNRYEEIPKFLKSYVLCEVLCQAAGCRKDIESVHIRLLQELMEKQTGRRLSLPYELEAVRVYDGISLEKKHQGKSEEKKGTENQQPRIRQKVFARENTVLRFPDTPYTKWFDYDIIKNTVKIRHRQPGDRLTIDSRGNSQKLKQYFINAKIPQKERDQIWLVADGNEIMWIVGFRQNQKYQISDRTKRILEIEIYEGDNKDDREDQSDDPRSRCGEKNRRDRKKGQSRL